MTSTSDVSSGVPYLNYSIDLEDPVTGVKHVIAAFCPFFNSAINDLKIGVISGGYTNRMYKVTSPSAERKEAVIVRIHVGFFGSFFDREQEFRLICFLHQKGLYGKIYGKFDNGVCYQYMEGRRLEPKDFGEPHMARLLAQKFAEFHAISRQFPEVRTPIHLKDFCLPVLNRLPLQYKDPAATLLAQNLFPGAKEMQEEFNFLINHANMENLYNDQTLVYCHNDLIPQNLLFNEDTEEVHIIDFEFAAWGYQIEDVGMYFSEFVGMDVSTMDVSLLPSEDFQLKWIRTYLETWNELTKAGRAVSEAEIWNFYVKASCFSLLKYWWMICYVFATEQDNPDYVAQAKRLEFDTLEFVKKKFDIYLQTRDRILGLELMPTV